MILIPKSNDAQTLDMFRHITLLNLKYKIIAKIMADRLASLIPFLILKENRGFIHGRNIQDCTCLVSKVVNVLDNKNKHGNMDLKVDIAKLFDTIS